MIKWPTETEAQTTNGSDQRFHFSVSDDDQTSNGHQPPVLDQRLMALVLWMRLPDELIDEAFADLLDVWSFREDDDLRTPEPMVTYAEGRIVETVERPPLIFVD